MAIPSAPLLIEDPAQLRAHPFFGGDIRARFFCAMPLACPDGNRRGHAHHPRPHPAPAHGFGALRAREPGLRSR
jgi:hypothetical protein